MGRKAVDLTEYFDVAEDEQTSFAAVSKSLRRLLARHAVTDDLVCPSLNLYERRDTWKDLKPDEKATHVIRGLASLHPSWVFCRASAALVHGFRVPYRCTHEIHVLSSGGGRTAPQPSDVPIDLRAEGAPSVAFHQRTRSSKAPKPPEEAMPFVKVDGVWATSPVETVLDCLQTLDITESLVIADSYLAQCDASAQDLVKLLHTYRTGCNGIQGALAVASQADGRPESGGESYARARIIQLGYAVPDLQVSFHDCLTGSEARVDFLWTRPDGTTVAGELDGMVKYTEPTMTEGLDTSQILVKQNLRDTRLALHVGAVMHFTIDIVRNDFQFCTLLDAFEVPYAPPA